MLVSGVHQSDSDIHVSILFQILFPIRLLRNIGPSSLCYTVGPCWLSTLSIAVCTCQSQTCMASAGVRCVRGPCMQTCGEAPSGFLQKQAVV